MKPVGRIYFRLAGFFLAIAFQAFGIIHDRAMDQRGKAGAGGGEPDSGAASAVGGLSGGGGCPVPDESRDPSAASPEFLPPRSIAPTPRLGGWGLTLALLATCLVPLTGLSLYAVFFGRAADRPLPVRITVDRVPIETADGRAAVLTDVIRIENLADHAIPNVTADLNGQYFLYRDSPLTPGETIIIPQNVFATKSNQRFAPGRYPIEVIHVTGRLPSGARGVAEATFPRPES